MQLGHERLDVYQIALGVARWAGAQVIPAARRHLRAQLVRAADSMVLNIAEGAGHEPGESRRHHYRIALGSASEVAAVLDLVALPGVKGHLIGSLSRRPIGSPGPAPPRPPDPGPAAPGGSRRTRPPPRGGQSDHAALGGRRFSGGGLR